MIHNFAYDTLIGVVLTVTGVFDSLKYHWEAQKVRLVEDSSGHSRKFINAAIINDVVRLVYFLTVKWDWYLLVASVVAVVTMLELYWMIYLYYPYETYPKRKTIRRPNLMTYIINSFIPNKFRSKL